MSYERPWKGIHFLVLEEAGVEVGADGVVRVPCRGHDGSVLRTHFFGQDGRTWWGSGTGVPLFGMECIPSPEIAAKSALTATTPPNPAPDEGLDDVEMRSGIQAFRTRRYV